MVERQLDVRMLLRELYVVISMEQSILPSTTVNGGDFHVVSIGNDEEDSIRIEY